MQKIDDLIKESMKAKNAPMLTGFRAVKTKILLEKTSATPTKLSDEQIFSAAVAKEIKEREEANSYFKDHKHPDFIDNTIIVEGLKKFLPQKLSATEQLSMIKKIITDTHTKSLADIGKVMGKLAEHKDYLDMKMAHSQIKEILGS